MELDINIDEDGLLRIEKMAIGGSGIGRTQDSHLVCFVPHSAPGDLLRVRVVKKHKNHILCKIIEIVEPGPGRREPPCPYAKNCGGCDWQQLHQAEQLLQKQKILQELFDRNFADQRVLILPMHPSPRSFHYRNRIQPRFQIKDKKRQIGFYHHSSHDLVSIEKCLIAEEPINEQIQALLRGEPPVSTPSLGVESTRIEISMISEVKAQAQWPKDPSEKLRSGDFAFSQVNRFQNVQLQEQVLSITRDSDFSHIYDLYAGSGNFTLPLSGQHKKLRVSSVELDPRLVAKGRRLSLGKPIRFYQGAVENFLKRHPLEPNSLVVLDPPRTGANPFVMRSLAWSEPAKIIYVSCHPITLIRDLVLLFKERKRSPHKPFRIQKVKGFEMFPQTSHFETIVEIN